MARPSKLTPEAQAHIVRAIELGATYELAAGYGGISYDTFNAWMKRGEKAASGMYRQFYEAVKGAESRAAVRWLARIDLADTWQAAAWKLERRYPRDYGRRVWEHTGADGGPIQLAINGVILDDDTGGDD